MYYINTSRGRLQFCQNLKGMDCGIHDGKMTGKVRNRTPLPARGYSKRLLRSGERGRRHLLLKSTLGSAQQGDSEEMEEERRESTYSGGTKQSLNRDSL